MKKSFTILLFALAGLSGKSLACSCAGSATFCEAFAGISNAQQPVTNVQIYLGTVSAISSTTVTMLIEKTYFGEDRTAQTLAIERGSSALCILELDNFQPGETFIIVPHKGADGLWRLGTCGVSVLEVINGKVRGPIAPGVSIVELAQFSTIADCGNLGELDLPIQVNPTLTSNEVNITTRLPSSVAIQVTVFDAAGRLVHQAKESAFDENKPIVLDMEAWASGMYFVRMDLLGRRKTVKVVKIDD
ncbi:MAG: T9SS type A sorting domain-containing protein [Saprospiraceae bacterium]|nr:T9SS type A sorting domain-containing protein [Saprospiraceae bacterium]